MKNEELYQLYDKFLERFPPEKLKTMTLDEYVHITGSDSFCSWLQDKTDSLGGIKASSLYKFGIYKPEKEGEKEKSNRSDGIYAWSLKYGTTKEEIFENIKRLIIEIQEAATSGNFEVIDKSIFAPTVKWKIAFLYSDFKLLNIFSRKNLKALVEARGFEVGRETPTSELHRLLMDAKGDADFFDYGHRLWDESKKILAGQEKRKQIEQIIEEYKIGLKADIEKQVADAVFSKWRSVKRCLGLPTFEEGKFVEQMEQLDFADLAYEMTKSSITELLENSPVEYEKTLKPLYDEKITLDDRINLVFSSVKELYDRVKKKKNHNHNHDERTLSVLLTYHNPEKYTFYQKAYYDYYCEKIKEKIVGKARQRYSHYLTLIEELADYVIEDEELTEYVDSYFTDDYYPDHKRLILAQDIMFRTERASRPDSVSDADKGTEEEHQTKPKMKKIPLNQIFYGPPGTGKTYNTVNEAIRIINPSFDLNQSRDKVRDEFERLSELGLIEFVTFHQSFSYEDFVEGIKPVLGNNNSDGWTDDEQDSNIGYEIQDGVFKRLCITNTTERRAFYKRLVGRSFGKYTITVVTGETLVLAKPRGGKLTIPLVIIEELENYCTDNNIDLPQEKKIDSEDIDRRKYPYLEPYIIGGYENVFPEIINIIQELRREYNEPEHTNKVLIIDEINRGNIASIFGELITLIEEDKRAGNDEQMSTMLPYSKEKFSVPNNVYLIGTMNTADRSVEALDIALRRRFAFKEMLPDAGVIKTKVVEDIDIVKMLNTINLRLEKLLGADYAIGHAYFMNIESKEQLKEVFENQIIPLLEEYFYGDYAKVGAVLGSSFVEIVGQDIRFAKFDNNLLADVYDMEEKVICRVTKAQYKNEDEEVIWNWDFSDIYS